jgi:CheY-like chemotaxis protein
VSQPWVLVAHDNEAIRRVIEVLLLGAGYMVRSVDGGQACLTALAEAPAALVLDVAIGDVMAFDLIDAAKRRTPVPRIVLIASIYNRTSYKRQPTSLYGADDYVEQHHIPDTLVGKLNTLLGTPQGVTKPAAIDAHEQVRSVGESELQHMPGADPVVRAQRLARLIVSDIALYNGDAFERARARGTDELQARLRLDLEEGRLLFDMRVSPGVRAGRDFIGEALAELIAGAASPQDLAKAGGEER